MDYPIMDRSFSHEFLIAMACNLLALESGFHDGLNIPKLGLGHYQERTYIRLDQSPWSVRDMSIGIIIGSLISLNLINRIGCKSTLILAIIPKMIFWLSIRLNCDLVTCFTVNVIRVNAGIGCGIIYAIIPIYLGEVLNGSLRSISGILMAVSLNIGMLKAYNLNFDLPEYVSTSMIVGLPILYLGAHFVLPKSSGLLKGRECAPSSDDKVLLFVSAGEHVEVEKSKEDDLTLKKSFQTIYQTMDNRKLIVNLIVLLVIVNVMSVLPMYTCKKLGLSTTLYMEVPSGITLVHCLVITFGGTISMMIIRKFNQKPIQISSGLSSLCVILGLENLTLFLLTLFGEEFDQFQGTTFIHVLLCTFGSALALHCVPFAFIGEVVLPEMKVSVGIVCTLNYALMRIGISQLFEVTGDNWGLLYFPLYLIVFVGFVGLFDITFHKCRTFGYTRMQN